MVHRSARTHKGVASVTAVPVLVPVVTSECTEWSVTGDPLDGEESARTGKGLAQNGVLSREKGWNRPYFISRIG